MRILAVDTCLPACSVAVLDDEDVKARAFEPMLRGHQERLAPMVQEAMAASGLSFPDLDRIVVTLGPGSFTGLRVGLSFAKGLGLALNLPVVGVNALEALAFGTSGRAIAIVDARRGQAYWQAFENGASLGGPKITAVGEAAAVFEGGPDLAIGPGADLLAAYFPALERRGDPAPDPVSVARLGAASQPGMLTPIYLRAPDAKLPGGIEPVWSN